MGGELTDDHGDQFRPQSGEAAECVKVFSRHSISPSQEKILAPKPQSTKHNDEPTENPEAG